MSDRLILAIDTSFGAVSAALVSTTGAVVAHVEADNAPGTQAETLPPLVAEMFAGAGVAFKQLARVVATVGPGAFTGVRIGLAFAKGLKLATGATVLGVTTLDCLAAQAKPERSIGVVLDAKRGEVYAQAFDQRISPLSEAGVMSIAEAVAQFRRTLKAPYLLTGSGAALLDELGTCEVIVHGRIDTCLLAQRMIDADPERYPPVPAYLRAPDARLPT
jgi:tRNA threonylcarbamoyladenosine biosynthesis protein TsaB